MADYIAALKNDLVEQFRGKKNIEALVEAIGHQLQDVMRFYEQLGEECDISTAAGAQLDGVGNIVDLSRVDAAKLAGDPMPFDLLNDEDYRKYLIYKILKNNCNCTYYDIIKAFRMFWDKPIYYKEDPDVPATMIFETDNCSPEDNAAQLLTIPHIRAAGVTVKILANTIIPEMKEKVWVGGMMGRGYMSTALPELDIVVRL